MTGFWVRDAHCYGYQPDAGEPWPWDTDQLRGQAGLVTMERRTDIAKAICAGCPVREQCLTEGLVLDRSSGMPYGIWGGSTPEERARIIGKRIKWVDGTRHLASYPNGKVPS